MTEFDQDDYTWTGNNAKSRLDRIYSSHSLEDQLDRWHTCAALDWAPQVSDHRVVAFARTSPKDITYNTFKATDRAKDDPRWAPIVRTSFQAGLIADATPYNAFRQLVLVKQAIDVATTTVHALRKEEARQAATNLTPDMDPLSATMGFLRAAERV